MEDGGPFVIVKEPGPNNEEREARAEKVAQEFHDSLNTFLKKVGERPGEDIQMIYNERPFSNNDPPNADTRETWRTATRKRDPNEIPTTTDVFEVFEVEAETRWRESVAKMAREEEEKRRKNAQWNPDQRVFTDKSDYPEDKVECQECNGACFLDSRRALMSCTNEPMLPELMADLLAQFYRLGWMTGSGGAMASISCDNRLLLSPSGLQKERIKPCDLFKSSPNSFEVRTPSCNPNGKPTACAGIFRDIIQHTGAQCVIHSHSKASNLITRACSGKAFITSGQEYIKGIYNMETKRNRGNDEILVVPIIENRPTEEDLEPQVREVLSNPEYRGITAILVRSHGVFVWGPTWQKAKIQAEIYEYLFDLSLDYLKIGIPLVSPDALARFVEQQGLTETPPLIPLSSFTNAPSAPPSD